MQLVKAQVRQIKGFRRVRKSSEVTGLIARYARTARHKQYQQFDFDRFINPRRTLPPELNRHFLEAFGFRPKRGFVDGHWLIQNGISYSKNRGNTPPQNIRTLANQIWRYLIHRRIEVLRIGGEFFVDISCPILFPFEADPNFTHAPHQTELDAYAPLGIRAVALVIDFHVTPNPKQPRVNLDLEWPALFLSHYFKKRSGTPIDDTTLANHLIVQQISKDNPLSTLTQGTPLDGQVDMITRLSGLRFGPRILRRGQPGQSSTTLNLLHAPRSTSKNLDLVQIAFLFYPHTNSFTGDSALPAWYHSDTPHELEQKLEEIALGLMGNVTPLRIPIQLG